MLTESEIGTALDLAEAGDSARISELSEANVEAIQFSIRFLRLALRGTEELDYRAITAEIGRIRDRPLA